MPLLFQRLHQLVERFVKLLNALVLQLLRDLVDIDAEHRKLLDHLPRLIEILL